MAKIPDTLRFTPLEATELAAIRAKALIRFEAFKKAERFKGRRHFPDHPFEFSWAYEMKFLRQRRHHA